MITLITLVYIYISIQVELVEHKAKKVYLRANKGSYEGETNRASMTLKSQQMQYGNGDLVEFVAVCM